MVVAIVCIILNNANDFDENCYMGLKIKKTKRVLWNNFGVVSNLPLHCWWLPCCHGHNFEWTEALVRNAIVMMLSWCNKVSLLSKIQKSKVFNGLFIFTYLSHVTKIQYVFTTCNSWSCLFFVTTFNLISCLVLYINSTTKMFIHYYHTTKYHTYNIEVTP